MTGRPLLSARSTSHDIRIDSPPFAMLPVGSCEQHGQHLPLLTDWLVASTVAEKVSDRLGGMLLPALPYSTSIEHRGFPGTVYLRASTLATVLHDIVESCWRFGCRRIAVLSGHGGNWILKPTVRELNADFPDMTVILVPEPVLWGGTLGDDLHAGRIETSIMLHLAPELVREERHDIIPRVGREFLDYLPMATVSERGTWGTPSEGTAEEGARVVEAMIDRVATYVTETFGALRTLRSGPSDRV